MAVYYGKDYAVQENRHENVAGRIDSVLKNNGQRTEPDYSDASPVIHPCDVTAYSACWSDWGPN